MLIGGYVDKIILLCFVVEVGECLGFLFGDMKEKVDFYMQLFYDVLNDFLFGKQMQKLMEEKCIEIVFLVFMCGCMLLNVFVVLDEVQNVIIMQMKMFLICLGEGLCMVIIGDCMQIDLLCGVYFGLIDVEKILKDVKGISFSYFIVKDVVCYLLVVCIIEVYDSEVEVVLVCGEVFDECGQCILCWELCLVLGGGDV